MDLTPEQSRLAELAKAVLAPRFPDAELKTVALPDDGAVYVYPEMRAGGVLIVGPDESMLFATSSIPVDTALAEYRNGRRSVIRPFENRS